MEKIPIRHIRAPQNELNSSESLSIRNVRDLLSGKDMIQELHRHDFFFILALKKGIGNHEIDFIPYKICDDSVFVMRPGQVHQLKLTAGSTGYLMAFKRDFYHPHDAFSKQLFRKVTIECFYRFSAKGFEKLMAALANIFLEHTSKKEGYKEVVKANLGIFFIELLRNRQSRKGPSNQVDSYKQQRLEEFMELLDVHIANHKQVSHYAELLNLSAYQLNGITRATLGKKCTDIINEYIILESKRYLLATSNQVSQIGFHLGYEDVSYFIRFFKKHTGYSPEAFRRTFK
jgi:AraC family transcriptional regulator, transcriptional activator of pobA